MKLKMFYIKKNTVCFPVFIFILLILSIPAIHIFAGDYDMVYSKIDSAGTLSQTTDYEISDSLSKQGITGESQGSADYSIANVEAVKNETTTGVDCWMLY